MVGSLKKARLRAHCNEETQPLIGLRGILGHGAQKGKEVRLSKAAVQDLAFLDDQNQAIRPAREHMLFEGSAKPPLAIPGQLGGTAKYGINALDLQLLQHEAQ